MMTKGSVFVLSAFGVGFLATTEGPVPAFDSPQMLQWLAQQGGLVVAIAFLLYFWRRDMHAWREEQAAAARERQQKVDLMLDVVRDNSTALANSAAANQSCSQAIDRLSTVVSSLVHRQ